MLAHPEPMGISLIVPTYRRPDPLRNCIGSILEGIIQPDEIVVVGREGDIETESVLAQLASPRGSAVSIRAVWVSTPGHIPAVEAGVRTATGEIVAIVDDDVAVTPAWLERLLHHFSDSCVGAVGGRVVVPGAPLPKLRGRPGQISWYGRHWGNIGSVDGAASFEAASVMEGNWAWRKSLLASLEFDPKLNFDDASMYGLDLCSQARRRGFKVVYEPQALVYHHAESRPPELDRADRPRRIFAYCRNYTYIMLKQLSWWRKPAFLTWWFLVGERGAWGPGAIAADTLFNNLRWRREAGPALAGKIEGVRVWLTRKE